MTSPRESTAPYADRVRQLLSAAERAGTLPAETGVSVAIVRGAETVYTGGFGLADRERSLPMTSRTLLNASSLTKSVTAASFARLARAKRLDLRAPIATGTIGKALPWPDPEIGSRLAWRDVLGHRSGLPAHDLLWYSGAAATSADLPARIAELDLVEGGFRGGFFYSNLLYGALEALFAEIAGESWTDYVGREFFARLGMAESGFAIPPDAATGYFWSEVMSPVDRPAMRTAGGLWANVEDLARWLAYLMREAESVPDDATPVADAGPFLLLGWDWIQEVRYDLGLFAGEWRGRTIRFHSGLFNGHSAAMAWLPDEHCGVVVLANQNFSPFPGVLARELLALCAGMAETGVAEFGPAPFAPAVDEAEEESPSTDVTAVYRHAAYGDLRLFGSGTGGRFRIAQLTGTVTPTADGGAIFGARALGLVFPLPGRFLDGGAALEIPLSLDPRVPPQRFTRI